MPLGELPDAERTCKRCEHDDDEVQATCGGCSRAWSGGHIEGALNDYWSEHGRSVRERAEKLIAELEALVPHPGDGSCDRCGVVPATHVPMSWEKPACPECAEKDAEIERLRAVLERIGGPHDCGCWQKCHCNSQAELLIWQEEAKSAANEALKGGA